MSDSTPGSHADLIRLEFSLPPKEPIFAHQPYLSHRYSVNPLQAISSLQLIPYVQAILKFHHPSSLDYRARNRLSHRSALQTPLRLLPFGNGSLRMGSTPLGGSIGSFLKKLYSNFGLHMKHSNLGRKCIL